MKVALCSVVSDEFVAGFICMYRTLLVHNPTWVEYPFFIFSHKKNCPLSDKAKALMAEHCEKAIFVEVNNDDYAGIHHYAETVIGTPPRLRAAFYILESFRLQNFDLVVSLDSDMIVLGPLDELLWEKNRFSSVRARDSTTNLPMRFVNTGVMVIGDYYLYPEILKDFTKALKTRPLLKGSGKADQAIINIFFQNETINYLPLKFNFTKRTVFNLLGKEKAAEASKVRRFLVDRDVRVLHYVGEKPWDTKMVAEEMEYSVIEDIWFHAFYQNANVAAIQWLDRRRRAQEQKARAKYAAAVQSLVTQKKWKKADFEEKLKKQLKKSA